MLHCVYGLHGTGKTTYLYDKLDEVVRSGRKAFFIVPEQSAVDVERTLIDRFGNPVNLLVEVINFKRLCNRVFRECGGIVSKTPDKLAMLLAMSHIASTFSDELNAYGKEANDADFSAQMLSIVNAMRQSRVSADDLTALLPELVRRGETELADKLHDIALLSERLDAYLSGTLEFPGDLLDKLYETLCEQDFFTDYTVFIDSFYGFTAQETAIIDRIMRTSPDVYITFLCDGPHMADPCFGRAKKASERIRELAGRSGVRHEDVFCRTPYKYAAHSALRYLSEHFSLGALAACDSAERDESVRIIACGSIYDEALAAVKTVSDLLLAGAKPREIALCAKDPASYEGILDKLFEDAGIPFAFDKHEDLSATPLASLVTSAFDVIAGSYQGRAVLSYIKTGLSGLTDEECDLLDLYIRTWHISGRAYYHTPFQMNPDGFTDAAVDRERLALIDSAQDKLIRCLDSFENAVNAASKTADLARAVWTLIEEVTRASGLDTFDDGAEGRDLDLLCKVLDAMVQTLGNEPMTDVRFRALFSACLRAASAGKIPGLIDEVRFSPVELMRTENVSHVLLLGVNDGVFPENVPKNGLLGDAEKKVLAALDLPFVSPDEDAAYDGIFLAYTALCAPKKSAAVFYRTRGMSGGEMYPSVIVTVLQKMIAFPKHEAPFDASDPENAVIGRDTLFARFLSMEDGETKEALRRFFAADEKYADRLRLAGTEDMTAQPLSREMCDTLWGEALHGSYSRLELFRKCPFSYFCTATLRLNPVPDATLGSIENGNIVHAALETLIARIVKGEIDGAGLREAVRAELERELRALLPENADGGAHTKRFEYLLYRLADSIAAVCESFMREREKSSFVPIGFEMGIGRNGIDPVEVRLDNGKTLCIIGKIDRVDLYHSEKDGKNYIRIIDYKTGTKEFKLENVRDGIDMQMLMYLYSVTKKPFGDYGTVYPAGVLYERAAAPDEPATLLTAAEKDQSVCKVKTSGLIVRNLDVVYAMDRDGSGDFIPVKFKNGAAAEDDPSLMDETEFAELLELVMKTAADIGSELSSGEKSARPYRDKNGKPVLCEYCDMRSICNVRQ